MGIRWEWICEVYWVSPGPALGRASRLAARPAACKRVRTDPAPATPTILTPELRRLASAGSNPAQDGPRQRSGLFDHPVGAQQDRLRDLDAQRLRGCQRPSNNPHLWSPKYPPLRRAGSSNNSFMMKTMTFPPERLGLNSRSRGRANHAV
jgi:hypothetical protein